ncbi:MAG: hypothetical protein HOY69_37290, partial [Streptomyces sp.]|nr:hypothetical protein [Streptomyces sp.]
PRSVRALVCGAAAVFAIGGVAIAAQGGGLPHPFRSPGGSTHRPATPTSHPPAGTAGTPSTAPSATGTPGPAAQGTTPAHPVSPTHAPAAATPAVSGKGLCESYLKAESEGTPTEPAVRVRLAEAAGGASRIDAYCAALVPKPGRPATTAPAPRTSHPVDLHATATSVPPKPTVRQ